MRDGVNQYGCLSKKESDQKGGEGREGGKPINGVVDLEVAMFKRDRRSTTHGKTQALTFTLLSFPILYFHKPHHVLISSAS